MRDKAIKLIARVLVSVAVAGGITAGAAGIASAKEIIIINDGDSCSPVCKVGPGSYTDWWNC